MSIGTQGIASFDKRWTLNLAQHAVFIFGRSGIPNLTSVTEYNTNPPNVAILRSLSLSLFFSGHLSVPKWQRDGFPVSISMATDSQPPSIPWHDSSSSGSWGRYKQKQARKWSDCCLKPVVSLPLTFFCWIYDDCMIGCMGTMLRCSRSQKKWPPMYMDGELTS